MTAPVRQSNEPFSAMLDERFINPYVRQARTDSVRDTLMSEPWNC